MTTLSRLLQHFSICLFIKGLTPASGGQSFSTPSGQGRRLLQLIPYYGISLFRLSALIYSVIWQLLIPVKSKGT